MSILDPNVAATRRAVRRALPDEPGLVLVAASGGADSLALAKATAFEAPRQGWRAGLITVDHQLQEGSRERADELVKWAAHNDLIPAEAVTVSVGKQGGPEAAARKARYEALAEAARAKQASLVLLGHTEDDQAETVLLALARGAGPRGLSGMPKTRVINGVTFTRPLLEISRRKCRQACKAQGLTPWEDPHNLDAGFARSRVRHEAMPALVKALGADVVANLARTATLLANDNAYLDSVAKVALEQSKLEVTALQQLPDAIRTRALHLWAISIGVPGAALSHRHVAALDALVTDWHGQGPTMLPGSITVWRDGGFLRATT